MIPKPLEEVSEIDVQLLISDAAAEGKTIDYKQALPGNSDADKKEFLADISSFANTAGGDLVFGVAESQGVPTEITGIGTADPDLAIRRLDSLIAAGVDPRVRYTTRIVECRDTRRILVVRVERSWAGPHSAASRKSSEHPAWRGLSAGHGGICAAMGFDVGRDAGVAGQRPAPRSGLEPQRNGTLVAQGHENAGRGAGSGAGAPPHWFSPEGSGPRHR